MTETEQYFLNDIQRLADEAPSVGLCSLPFKTIHAKVAAIIKEKDKLAEYREPHPVLPYKMYAGKCPNCGVVFLDDSTNYCGNCGLKIEFPQGVC